MKRFLTNVITALMAVLLTLTFVACKDAHTHTFSTEWSKNETHHWNQATCEHTEEVSNKAEHNFEGNTCADCGYTKPNDGGDDATTDNTGSTSGNEGTDLPPDLFD